MSGSGKPSLLPFEYPLTLPAPLLDQSSSLNTRAIMGLRIIEVPRFMSSMVIPGNNKPGLSDFDAVIVKGNLHRAFRAGSSRHEPVR